ncbi:hypothetical protein [Secundilactobacillus kimchicus]|uniref:Uncharacterized protein n=1 Tax=Secundilactobacillus kimchicus JCM 15530 TaxID=1302272 RepID=A0A0R1HMR2_9LACO|nr:hypothetical protein [Secundilactobacillus kimchicus]KRK48126.1 hypothetical protein FC96_GL001858 [Secundilactobacillus kimchicus JCM 15530]MBT9670909.1 hypothetical protein [Secundilactobacillus kimchicus]
MMTPAKPIDNFQPHIDYNQTRPMTLKDLNQLDPAMRGFVQTHAFGVDPKTNHFLF